MLTTRRMLDAESARVVAAEHADIADERRRLADDTVASVVASGFARHLVPARRGGSQGGFAELTDAVARLGSGCTSAAWLASLFASAARLGAYLPEEGQAEPWGAGPDTLIAAALVPGGRARMTTEGSPSPR